MAKTDPSSDNKQISAPSAGAGAAEPLTLQEFCTRLSQSDRRVELIGGFFAVEKRAGRSKDTESAFNSRFVKFINQPV